LQPNEAVKKKIGVQHLRLGMYVSELDRPWIESRFLFQGFEVRTKEELDELQRICKYVYVETDLEHQPDGPRPRASLPIGAPAPDEFAAKRLGFEILDKFSEHQPQKPRYTDLVSIEEEMGVAREIERETRSLVYNIMEDARLGRALDTATAKNLVHGVVRSVLRNPDALVCLTQLKNKDEYTAMHSVRVCVLALAFGRHLGLSEQDLNILGLGALLHDVGKMKVPTEILNKPGGLTPDEFTLMKRHVPFGVQILEQNSGIPEGAIEVVKGHHERFDGSGYALGLKGDQIGLFGQVGAIVDCYDAITSDRAYHKGMSPHDALRKLYEWRRKDFHDRLVEQFIQCMGIYPIGSVVEMNTGSIGVVLSVNRIRRLRPRVALVLDADKRPFQSVKIIDLMQERPEPGRRAIEIRNVLPVGSFGINPVQYLPLTA
jgi:putative nucleotidyltransferase with HDIG domain